MQSVDTIIPTCLLASRETKKSFQTFKPFFEIALALGKNNPDINPLLMDGFWLFKLAVECDMSATFKGVGKGSNLKNLCFGCLTIRTSRAMKVAIRWTVMVVEGLNI
jgi:hypothetical protein